MQILAISGSLRASSSNTALLRAAARLAPADVEVLIYDGLDDLPHFSPERDTDNPPASVIRLREQIKAADGLIICTPEYAYGMPGVLKNALDWMVSSGELVDKPVAAISASPNALGGQRAHASLVLTLTALSARVLEDASLNVTNVRTKLDGNGEVTDPATAQALRLVVDTLVQTVNS